MDTLSHIFDEKIKGEIEGFDRFFLRYPETGLFRIGDASVPILLKKAHPENGKGYLFIRLYTL